MIHASLSRWLNNYYYYHCMWHKFWRKDINNRNQTNLGISPTHSWTCEAGYCLSAASLPHSPSWLVSFLGKAIKSSLKSFRILLSSFFFYSHSAADTHTFILFLQWRNPSHKIVSDSITFFYKTFDDGWSSRARSVCSW